MAVKVSDDGDRLPWAASLPATATVTATVGRDASATVKVASSPSSTTSQGRPSGIAGASARPAVSSSRIVSSTVAGASSTPDARPEIATRLPFTALSARESMASSLEVTVTTPVLAVSSLAMVSVVACESEKSPATALVPAAAETVTVVAVLTTPLRRAVTVARRSPSAASPSSSMLARDSSSVTVGFASSSTMVSVTASGAATPWPPATLAATVTLLSGS